MLFDIENILAGEGDDKLTAGSAGANDHDGGVGNDIFQLDWTSERFYSDSNTKNAGRADYVLITDFTVGQDKLQLDGAASNYYLGASGVAGVTGTGLWAEQVTIDELIAIIRSANSRALNAANTVNTAILVCSAIDSITRSGKLGICR